MALVESVKKGGPHTKKDQKERKDKVYELHFEKGISAVKIAETLGVNRNTVNEDIREWYVKVSEELPEQNSSLLLKQMQRLEIQYLRLVEELDKCKDFKEKIAIEKLMFALSSKITSETSKIVFHRNDVLSNLRLRIKNPGQYEYNEKMKMIFWCRTAYFSEGELSLWCNDLRHIGAHYWLSKTNYNYGIIVEVWGWHTIDELKKSYGQIPPEKILQLLN